MSRSSRRYHRLRGESYSSEINSRRNYTSTQQEYFRSETGNYFSFDREETRGSTHYQFGSYMNQGRNGVRGFQTFQTVYREEERRESIEEKRINGYEDRDIVSPPRLRYSGCHNTWNPRREMGYEFNKSVPLTFPVQTRCCEPKNVEKQLVQKPLIPLCNHRHVGHPSLGIHHLRLPNRYLAILEQGKNFCRIWLSQSLLKLSISLVTVVKGCEQHANNLKDGWSTNLYSLTKQDIALYEIPHLYEMVRPIMSYMKAVVTQLYGMKSLKVDRNQPHVLKYSGSHRGVELHHDKSDITMNLMLSHSNAYSGGGTYFRDANENVRLEFGEFLIHLGSAVHAGTNIDGGTRYLMVVFADEKH